MHAISPHKVVFRQNWKIPFITSIIFFIIGCGIAAAIYFFGVNLDSNFFILVVIVVITVPIVFFISFIKALTRLLNSERIILENKKLVLTSKGKTIHQINLNSLKLENWVYDKSKTPKLGFLMIVVNDEQTNQPVKIPFRKYRARRIMLQMKKMGFDVPLLELQITYYYGRTTVIDRRIIIQNEGIVDFSRKIGVAYSFAMKFKYQIHESIKEAIITNLNEGILHYSSEKIAINAVITVEFNKLF